MPSYDTAGRISYAYDADTDTWFAMLGKASTGANYDWTGSHSFATNMVAKLKFNCFLNPAARTSAIPSPAVGLLTFIQEDAGANTVNRFEFWDGSAWSPIADPNAATLAGTETLTNKTMSGADNTFSNIPTSSISGLDTAINAAKYLSISAQTASYTLALSDDGKIVEVSNASANTLTVPPNSSVAFPLGTQIIITQTGAGQTTLTAGAGVTINATPGLKLRTQWSTATIVKRATDTWIAFGDLVA